MSGISPDVVVSLRGAFSVADFSTGVGKQQFWDALRRVGEGWGRQAAVYRDELMKRGLSKEEATRDGCERVVCEIEALSLPGHGGSDFGVKKVHRSQKEVFSDLCSAVRERERVGGGKSRLGYDVEWVMRNMQEPYGNLDADEVPSLVALKLLFFANSNPEKFHLMYYSKAVTPKLMGNEADRGFLDDGTAIGDIRRAIVDGVGDPVRRLLDVRMRDMCPS